MPPFCSGLVWFPLRRYQQKQRVFLSGIVQLHPSPSSHQRRRSVTSPGPVTTTRLSNCGAPSCGVTGIADVSLGPSEGRGAVRSVSHPFSSFHRTIRFRSLQMRSSISLTFKNTPSLPLGTYVMLSPRPLSLLSSVPTAAASCSSASIHSGGRMPIFLCYRHTQSTSLDLVGWLEQSWLIHHHREKGSLTINTLPHP